MPSIVSFIMGRAGTGKTELLLSKIKENESSGKRSVLIVPDRATFSAEKRLSELLGKGIMNTFIVSFTSLARRVASEIGDGRVFLSMQGRQMLLRRTIEENKSSLTAFSRVALHRGFTKECDEMILKCKRFGIEPAALVNAASDESLPLSLRDKLRDFAAIFDNAAAAMDMKYMDGEDLVNSLIENLPASAYCAYDFFVDAPETLNEQSVRILSVLFNHAPKVTITIRGDTSDFCRDRRLFDPDAELYRQIRREAEKQGCAIEFLSLSKNMRMNSPEIRHLERELFAFPYKSFEGDAPAIELHAAGNRIQEVNACAESIRQAVRNGLRYRDIGVIVGDPDGYAPIIRRIFPDYAIPFFMDSKRSLSSHSVSELILASLSCCESGFSAQSFIRAIKSGLFPIEPDAVERLENHILKYGLNGRLITEPFTQQNIPEGIDEARAAAVVPLLHLKEGIYGQLNARERIHAIYDFLLELQIGELLKRECERLAKYGEFGAARETAQVFDTIVELLDQLYIILGDEVQSLKKFISVLEEGLRSYSIGIIPTTCDQVFFSCIDISSFTEIQYLLILGMNEGLIPTTKADNAIINDSELRRLSAIGLPVWNSTERMNRTEGLRVYSAVMRTRSRLRISYSLAEANGTPSAMFERIRKLFPRCIMTNGILNPITGSTERAQFSKLANSLKQGIMDKNLENAELTQSYAYFAASTDYSERLSIMDGAFFDNGKSEILDPENALKLYGRHMVGTPTRLETFNKCPFRYFMEYGMSVHERDEFSEKVNDRGSFIHAALEQLINGFIADNVDWSSITDEEISERLQSILVSLASEHNKGIYLSSASMRFELRKLYESIAIAGRELVRQIALGEFRPIQGEVSFGRRGDLLPALTIQAGNGVRFNVCGVVDRLDSFNGSKSDRDYLRIIDYKSGQTRFDYTELVCGIRLQLPLYAAAMEAGLNAERKLLLNSSMSYHEKNQTAGFYYQFIGTPDAETAGLDKKEAEIVLKEVHASFKLHGLTLSDDAVIQATERESGTWSGIISGLSFGKDGPRGNLADAAELEHTIEFAKAAAANTLNAIMQGRIEVSPSLCGNKRGCEYCKFGSICGFDRTAGDRYRRIRGITADEFFHRKGC